MTFGEDVDLNRLFVDNLAEADDDEDMLDADTDARSGVRSVFRQNLSTGEQDMMYGSDEETISGQFAVDMSQALMETLKVYDDREVLGGGDEGVLEPNDLDAKGLCFKAKCRRFLTEDSILIKPNLLAVADGLGGEDGGHIVSQGVLKYLAEKSGAALDESFLAFMSLSLLENHNLNLEASTTLSMVRAVMVEGESVGKNMANIEKEGGDIEHQQKDAEGKVKPKERVVLECMHVGDSKIVLISLSEKRILWSSTDQSLVQMRLNSGALKDPIERHINIESNIVYNCISATGRHGDPERYVKEVDKGEVVAVVCSDGISGFVTDEEILAFVLENGYENCHKGLAKLAMDRQLAKEVKIMLEGRERVVSFRGRGDHVAIAYMKF